MVAAPTVNSVHAVPGISPGCTGCSNATRSPLEGGQDALVDRLGRLVEGQPERVGVRRLREDPDSAAARAPPPARRLARWNSPIRGSSGRRPRRPARAYGSIENNVPPCRVRHRRASSTTSSGPATTAPAQAAQPLVEGHVDAVGEGGDLGEGVAEVRLRLPEPAPSKCTGTPRSRAAADSSPRAPPTSVAGSPRPAAAAPAAPHRAGRGSRRGAPTVGTAGPVVRRS